MKNLITLLALAASVPAYAGDEVRNAVCEANPELEMCADIRVSDLAARQASLRERVATARASAPDPQPERQAALTTTAPAPAPLPSHRPTARLAPQPELAVTMVVEVEREPRATSQDFDLATAAGARRGTGDAMRCVVAKEYWTAVDKPVRNGTRLHQRIMLNGSEIPVYGFDGRPQMAVINIGGRERRVSYLAPGQSCQLQLPIVAGADDWKIWVDVLAETQPHGFPDPYTSPNAVQHDTVLTKCGESLRLGVPQRSERPFRAGPEGATCNWKGVTR